MQATTTHNAASTAFPRRRQNKSCDQCRTGKRRCDVQVNVQHGPDSAAFLPGDDGDADAAGSGTATILSFSPCTNCKKWKKACTVEWIKSHQKRQSTIASRRRPSKDASRPPDELLPPKPEPGPWADAGVSANLQSNGDIDTMLSDYLNRSISSEPQPEGSNISPMSTSIFESFNGSQDDAASLANAQPYQPLYDFTTLEHRTHYPVSQEVHQPIPVSVPQPMIDREFPYDTQSTSSFGSSKMGSWGPPISTAHSVASIASVTDSQEEESAPPDRQLSPVFHVTGLLGKTASPFASNFLAEEHSRLYIKQGLLKIYHDSLEGALSCWLTERNCPYASSPFVDEREAWSTKFSNRVVTRVRALDEAYARSGLISTAEQKQASNVLNCVVMAFAAQWAQTTYKQQNDISHQLPEHGLFGRNMQKQLWHRANAALSQAVTNPSFRVIFAGIIFSLTQRPMDAIEVLPKSGGRRQPVDLTSLRQILDLDHGPIFLDVAVRKLHDHQRRRKDAESRSTTDGGSLAIRAPLALTETEKQTFGLVFWLAIMFDTISATMNRRSFALSDGDTSIGQDEAHLPRNSPPGSNGLYCDLDGYSGFSGMNSSQLARDNQVWGNYFLRQQSRVGDIRKQTTRWPCSYTDAAACLADAAPVKVLMYRRVGHLQDLFYQRAAPEAIESAIAATLEVYNHWNNSYGRFIGDCVAHHETLPTRIQSWYILLANHWHLSILILADLIERVDDTPNLTLPANRTTRQTTEFCTALRFRSVYAVADLGRCSRYIDSSDLSFSQSPDFHHAVNRAALLTEPWTVVLVRTFAHAGEVLVKLVLSQREPGLFMDADNIAEARTRLNDCIEALWLLGRKSDMALSAAKVLSEAVNQA